MSELRAFAYRERAMQAHKKAMRAGIPEETRRAWLIVERDWTRMAERKRSSWTTRCLGFTGWTTRPAAAQRGVSWRLRLLPSVDAFASGHYSLQIDPFDLRASPNCVPSP